MFWYSLIFSIYGPRDIPNNFPIKNFWVEITGDRFYTTVGAKASTIQNLCFWYAQNALAYILFGQGDSNDVANDQTQKKSIETNEHFVGNRYCLEICVILLS